MRTSSLTRSTDLDGGEFSSVQRSRQLLLADVLWGRRDTVASSNRCVVGGHRLREVKPEVGVELRAGGSACRHRSDVGRWGMTGRAAQPEPAKPNFEAGLSPRLLREG